MDLGHTVGIMSKLQKDMLLLAYKAVIVVPLLLKKHSAQMWPNPKCKRYPFGLSKNKANGKTPLCRMME